VGSFAETAEASETHFCVPPLRNGALSGGSGEQRDKLYCGKGKDTYFAEKIDYVDSSCEKKELGGSA
jgi:hypothetical protein